MTTEPASDAEETIVLVCLLSVFAMCVEKASPRLITASDSGYRLVSKLAEPDFYELAIWRCQPLAEPELALITVAKAPGVRNAAFAHAEHGAIPLDDISSRWLLAELWGITAQFQYPSTADEMEALRRLAWY